MHRNEDPKAAAIRETREEIGVVLSSDEMSGPIIVRGNHEFRTELNYIFEVQRQADFALFFDNREITGGSYFTVREVNELIVTPTVRLYLENKLLKVAVEETR